MCDSLINIISIVFQLYILPVSLPHNVKINTKCVLIESVLREREKPEENKKKSKNKIASSVTLPLR